MPYANQGSRCAAQIAFGAALLLGFAPSTATETNLKKVCKVGMMVNILEHDGTAMSCRALGLQANAYNYQIGCLSTEVKDEVILTTPIHINDKSARLTASSLVANIENAHHEPEELAACVEVWVVR
jgi:hypothetical protein